MVNLKDKVAIVTGAARGIGRGCALEMAKAGADVIVTDCAHPEESQEVAELVQKIGRKAIVVPLDVADRREVENMVQAVQEKFGKIDILVNNAAASVLKPFLEISVEEMAHVLSVSGACSIAVSWLHLSWSNRVRVGKLLSLVHFILSSQKLIHWLTIRRKPPSIRWAIQWQRN